jgi:hypothetical protein
MCRFRVPPYPGIERPRRLILKLLLPGVNLVGMDLASSAIFAFSPASIRRLVFFVIVRSVYQTERPFSNLTSGPKNGSTSEGRPPKTKETFLSSDEPARGQTRDKIGSFASVSGRTVEKIAAVVKAAAESPQGRLDRDLVAGLYARAAPRLAKGS